MDLIARDFGPLRCLYREGGVDAPIFMPLHGRGGTSKDIYLLGQTVANGCHLVAPDASNPWPPEGPVTGRSWYSQNQARRTEEIARSREQLTACIEAVRKLHPRGMLILLGFSQGAVMTLDTGLRENGPAGLLIALSGFLHEDVGGPTSPPVLIVHGTADDIIPVSSGRAAHERLKKRGVRVQYREVPVDHSIRHPVIAAIKGFLREHGVVSQPRR